MAFVFFVVVPILITLMVPFSTVEFRHDVTGPTVIVTRFALVAVPWRTIQIENVTRVRADVMPDRPYRGTREEQRRGARGTSYGTGQLAIVNDGPEVIVQAAPELAKDIAAQFDRFVTAKGSEPIVRSVYASWWLSYVFGGVVTGLFALYAVGVVLAILSFLLKLVKR
jgi:hypothetical protein